MSTYGLDRFKNQCRFHIQLAISEALFCACTPIMDLIAVVAAITPGPSNLILTSTGANVGLLRGLPSLGGVVIGMGLMMFLVAFGLGNVVLASPGLILILKWGGIAFLLWLSWKIATA